MFTLRTRFKKDIVAEFLVPRRDSGRVIIICGGMPSVPSQKSLLEFWAKKGFWVFYPRYRGTWESGGKFLSKSPAQDILDIIEELPKGFTSLWDGKRYRIKPKKIFVLGTSFGGATALLTSRDSRINKVVALSPVVDWRAKSRAEPLSWLVKFTHKAFGEAYRFSDQGWEKLSRGKFFNPMHEADRLDGKKIFVIHALDDKSVSVGSVKKFIKKVGCKFWLLSRGGHLFSSTAIKPRFYKKIKKFLNDKS